MEADDSNSWDVVSKNDLWDSNVETPDLDEYVLVGQEDIVEGIACFMAAYLLSIKEAKVGYLTHYMLICNFRYPNLKFRLDISIT